VSEDPGRAYAGRGQDTAGRYGGREAREGGVRHLRTPNSRFWRAVELDRRRFSGQLRAVARGKGG